jgi:hypothetical protein
MATATLQPGSSGIDARIVQSDGGNYGDFINIGVGESNAGALIMRGVIRFDLSSIPAAAQVSSATLSLWLSSAGSLRASNDRAIRLYRIKRNWVESQVSWNVYSTGNNWQTAGCNGANDREASDIGSSNLRVLDAIDSEHQFALTPAAVQEWISGSVANNGVLLKCDTETDDMYFFHSSDSTSATLRPKLVVNYTLPALRRRLIICGGSS